MIHLLEKHSLCRQKVDQFPRVQTLGTATRHLQFIQKQKTCVDGRCACRLSSGEGTPWLAMSGPTSHNQLQLDFRQDLHQLSEALGGMWWLSTCGFSLLPLKHCSHHAELDSSPLAVFLQFCSGAFSADKYIILYRRVIKWWHNIGAEKRRASRSSPYTQVTPQRGHCSSFLLARW